VEELLGDTRALRDDWRELGLSLWLDPIVIALPQPSAPRMAWNEGTLTLLAHAQEIAEERGRLAKRLDESTAVAQERIRQARAMAGAGDPMGALSLLRTVADGDHSEPLRRDALWQMALLHRALADEPLVAETLDEWWDLHPTDAEGTIALRWEDDPDD